MTRILSALLLIPLVVGIVWLLPAVATLAVATLAALVACYEYGRMAEALGAPVPRVAMAVGVVAACVALGSGWVDVDVVLLSVFLLLGTVMISTRQPGRVVLPAAGAAALAVLYIGLPLGAIAAVRTLGGPDALLLLIATIVVSDSAQYYTGRALGRAPLAPAISPKKTREGAIGGVLFGTAALVLGGRYVFPAAPLGIMVPAAAAIVVLGIVGDLFESLLKRSAGIKDSSALIPGHGGVLDRIDSWLFAGPAYYLLVRYLQP
jgi:phosphatidate cytidylyltransferase